MASAFLLENFSRCLEDLERAGRVADSSLVKEVVDHAALLGRKLGKPGASWKDFPTFWPPRLVEAMVKGESILFFGAGISLSSGIPTWNQLLTESFRLDESLTQDEDLKNDPLTLAELAGQYLGTESLQEVLRTVMNRPKQYSTAHAALAALRCRVYVTTNYDCLFEKAWEGVNGASIPLAVVTNDADLTGAQHEAVLRAGGTVLYKIHGSSDRHDEHMILTRRDYRFHYRANEQLFSRLREYLRTRHTLFVGFSHRDPEVSRLVDDAIHEYEREQGIQQPIAYRPQFYSMQFDMRAHTPEIFAARGIVALTPPLVPTAIDNLKSRALAVALADLIYAKQLKLHNALLDTKLAAAVEEIATPLRNGLDCISGYHDRALAVLRGEQDASWLDDLCSDLGDLSSQGVYLLDDQGMALAHSVPGGLDRDRRKPPASFSQRPYFQQAKLFRQPFVSNSVESIFNENSTFFVCVPILSTGQMAGLLFAACQIGQWEVPIRVAERLWEGGYTFLLIDGNGVCLLPPSSEFGVLAFDDPDSVEDSGANTGYRYERLLVLSRRDVLVRHISKSVVPVAQDDDVLKLSEDLRQYTIVSEVPRTRWKIGVSLPVASG